MQTHAQGSNPKSQWRIAEARESSSNSRHSSKEVGLIIFAQSSVCRNLMTACIVQGDVCSILLDRASRDTHTNGGRLCKGCKK
eukprot:6480840-Amphidinium_carterae.1